MESQRTLPIVPMMLIALVAAVMFGCFVADINLEFTSHSRTSHSTQVTKIDKCFNNPSNTSSFFVQSDGRYLQYCTNNGRESYWRVYECTKDGALLVITQFSQKFRINTDRITKYIQSKRLQNLNTKQSPCFGGV